MSSSPLSVEHRTHQLPVLRLRTRLLRGVWAITVGYAVAVGLWALVEGLLQPGPAGSARGLTVLAFILVSGTALHLAMGLLVRRAMADHDVLARAEGLQREQFHTLPCPAWVYDLSTLRMLDANPAALEFFGVDRDTFLGWTLPAIWPETEHARLSGLLAQVRDTQAVGFVATEDLRTRTGLRHAEVRSSPLALPDGPARLVVAVDRSAEREAMRSRAEALERLQEAQAIAHLGSWELDPRTRLGQYSDEVYRMMARAVPAQRRHRFEDLLAASDTATQARIDQLLEDIYTSVQLQVDVMLPLIAGNGQPRMIHLCAESVTDAAGQPLVHGTLQDVTDRERSRRLLREREEQFRELVRVLPDGVLILSDERVMYANAAAALQFGFDGEAILGEPLAMLVVDADQHHVRQLLRATPAADPAPTARRMHRRDGSTFYAGLSVGQVRYGGRECRLLVVRDLSEPERMRDALAESNAELQAMARRLFSLQEDERRAISRDLHDDIGQAITAMKLSAYAALEEPDADARRDDLQEVVQLADSTVTKLRNLSMLLRPPQLDALGLEAALRWQASMLFRASTTRLELDIAPLPHRPGNEIEQACFRIAQESLTNALRHACAGEVTLSLRQGGGRLRLEVVDDGDGFDPDGPRGLGLIVMRERAQTAGGTLQIASAPGAGTRVSLQLPYPGDADASRNGS